MVEKDKMIELLRIFNNATGALSEYLASFCKKTCNVKVLVVEPMLTSDFWAIAKKPAVLGILDYESGKEPVISHISHDIEKILLSNNNSDEYREMTGTNDVDIIKEAMDGFSRIVCSELAAILDSLCNINIETGVGIENVISSIYPVIVISIEVMTEAEKGMINISIPQRLLKRVDL